VLARPVYDRIGGQYREGRREEPRIAAALDELDLGYRVVVATPE
jgi:hypothetical protein